MKRAGASIIFYNSKGQVLLFLRDDNPNIPYPNMWDLPGGHVEPEETPRQCIVREMHEEMELELCDFQLLNQKEFSDRIEYTFYKQSDLQIDQITLHEGQKLRWFSLEDAANTKLAYGFNEILADFASYMKKSPPAKK